MISFREILSGKTLSDRQKRFSVIASLGLIVGWLVFVDVEFRGFLDFSVSEWITTLIGVLVAWHAPYVLVGTYLALPPLGYRFNLLAFTFGLLVFFGVIGFDIYTISERRLSLIGGYIGYLDDLLEGWPYVLLFLLVCSFGAIVLFKIIKWAWRGNGDKLEDE